MYPAHKLAYQRETDISGNQHRCFSNVVHGLPAVLVQCIFPGLKQNLCGGAQESALEQAPQLLLLNLKGLRTDAGGAQWGPEEKRIMGRVSLGRRDKVIYLGGYWTATLDVINLHGFFQNHDLLKM